MASKSLIGPAKGLNREGHVPMDQQTYINFQYLAFPMFLNDGCPFIGAIQRIRRGPVQAILSVS